MSELAQIKQCVAELTNDQQRLFGALCCEKLVPNFQAYVKAYHLNEFNSVEDALDLIWLNPRQSEFAIGDIGRLLLAIEEQAPNLDIHDSVYSWPAIYATDAISEMLRYILDGDVQHINNIMDMLVASIDQYIRDVTFPLDMLSLSPDEVKEAHMWVQKSPLLTSVYKELQRFCDLLVEQESQLSDLKRTVQTSGIRPIDRGLIISDLAS